jgi:putative ABC transport system ATP-binding protein
MPEKIARHMIHFQLLNVSKSIYKDKLRVTILEGVRLSVDRGELVVVMGASGSGKTTLLRLINRLMEPDSGSILFNDVDIRRIEPTQLRRRIVLVQQIPFMFEGSVLDNLLFGARLWGREADVEIETLLEDFQIPETLLSSQAKELSVGEAQRVALARAMALKPEVLLLDEPTSALDEETKNIIEQTLLRYNHKGLTMLWVSHESEQALRVGGRVLRLEAGRIVEA